MHDYHIVKQGDGELRKGTDIVLCPALEFSRFFLESGENARMAGLLTYSDNERLPEIFAVSVALLFIVPNGTYSSGTVQDFHLIPF